MIKFEIEQLHGHLIACCRRHIVIVGGRVYVSQHVQLFVGTYIEGTGHKRLNFCFVVKFYNCDHNFLAKFKGGFTNQQILLYILFNVSYILYYLYILFNYVYDKQA